MPLNATVAVLFSGGLDSSILLAHLIGNNQRVQPLYVDSGLHWQHEERRHAERFLAAIAAPALEPLVALSLPLADLYDGHWSITGRGVPGADEPDEKVYLPGRNPLLIIKAHVWCRLHGIQQLALGSLKNNPFADATRDFFLAFETAMDRAVSGHVQLVRPLADLDKRQVMQLAPRVPLELTFSCLDPRDGLHCGSCNKCAERRAAFRQADLLDPTPYRAVPRPIAT
jgi:7-cyano-7-deazaguanine synthase